MPCQAPLRVLLALTAVWSLAGCDSVPSVHLREVPSHVRAQLQGNTRTLSEVEMRTRNIHIRPSVTTEGTVTVPMALHHGVPEIPARINGGEDLPMLVDTGSQVCLLEARTAAARRVSVFDQQTIGMTLSGTSGRERAMVGLPDVLRIGSWSMKQFPLLVRTHESSLRFSWWEQHNVGFDVFGMDAIRHSCSYLTLDFPAQRVVFGIGRRFTAPSGKRVWSAPLVMRDGLPHVKLQTGGKTWTALVDSGFNGLIEMDRTTAERLHVLDKARPSDAFRVGIGAPVRGEKSHYGMITLPQLGSLGPRMTNIATLIVPDRSKIGCGLLRPFRVTLDFRRGLLWLEDGAKSE